MGLNSLWRGAVPGTFCRLRQGANHPAALRDGEPTGLLLAESHGLWINSLPFAFAPIAWIRESFLGGGMIMELIRANDIIETGNLAFF